MIFRWSIWGNKLKDNIELLSYSILSFKKQFGSSHQYIVYTDNYIFVSKNVPIDTVVKEFPLNIKSKFCITSKATWKKWCPSPRLDISQVEFFIDLDVFLLKYPREIDIFLSDKKMKFAIMDEYCGQPYQHGAMQKKTSEETPFVNAGFFVQKAGFDISVDLINEFDWWQQNIEQDEQTHHDEQGGLAIALTKYFINNELYILPKTKYMIISETSNAKTEDISDITLFHATYPTHPAFYKFKNYLDVSLKNNNHANKENV